MKVTNRGEWMRHKWKTRKVGLKFTNCCSCKKTKKLLASKVTDERIGDGKMLKTLVEQVKDRDGKIWR